MPASLKSLPSAVPMDSVPDSPVAAGNTLPKLPRASASRPPVSLANVARKPSQETTFGYLSALESAEHGYFGGYLIVSPLGRPLEFHCTAPVRPSRAQANPLWPTLEPYLLGEQIAGAVGCGQTDSRR